jgi:hypothetical protein
LSIQVRTVIFDRSSSRGCPFDVRGIDEHDTTEMAGGIAVETPPALPPSGPCALTASINISLIPGELHSASPISRDRPGSSRSAIDIRRFNLFRGSFTGHVESLRILSTARARMSLYGAVDGTRLPGPVGTASSGGQ